MRGKQRGFRSDLTVNCLNNIILYDYTLNHNTHTTLNNTTHTELYVGNIFVKKSLLLLLNRKLVSI